MHSCGDRRPHGGARRVPRPAARARPVLVLAAEPDRGVRQPATAAGGDPRPAPPARHPPAGRGPVRHRLVGVPAREHGLDHDRRPRGPRPPGPDPGRRPGPERVAGQTLGVGPTHLDVGASIQHAEEAQAAVSSAVGPVGLASVAVAILVIIAATGTWLERRRVELRVLAIRGAPPWSLAVKAVLELSVPDPGRRRRGPGGGGHHGALVRPQLGRRAAGGDGGRGVGTGRGPGGPGRSGPCVVASRVRHLDVRAGVLGEKERLPLWELLVLALAAAAFYELPHRGGAVVSSGPVERVDGLVLLFPVLMLAGVAGLDRPAGPVAPDPRLAARRLPTAGWLAARRLEAGRWRAAPMVTAAAVSIGIVMFGASLAASCGPRWGPRRRWPRGPPRCSTCRYPSRCPATDPASAHRSTLVTVTAEDAAGRATWRRWCSAWTRPPLPGRRSGSPASPPPRSRACWAGCRYRRPPGRRHRRDRGYRAGSGGSGCR